jgi:hypothetical protein
MECGGKRSATPLLCRRESGVAFRLPPPAIISFPAFVSTLRPRSGTVSISKFELSSKLLGSRLQVPAQKTNRMFPKHSLPQPIRRPRPFDIHFLVDRICARRGDNLISIRQS